MSILLFVVFGLVVGLLARAIMPGKQPMGWVATALLGIAGAFLGGLLSSLFTDHRVTDLHTAGIKGSIFDALLLLFIGRAFLGNRGAFA